MGPVPVSSLHVVPMATENLTDIDTHFAFGENWADFARSVNDAAISEAESALSRLVEKPEIEGRDFLDIGCGSGLHSLAATRLGANRVLAADLDPRSVATAQALLSTHAAERSWSVETKSVFDMTPDQMGRFGIVYSWGVLHHTGDLDRAMRCAARLVADNGLFAFALYRRTPLDWFWIREKRWYANTKPRAQRAAQSTYLALLRMGLLASGRSYRRYVETYQGRRGMNLRTDIHDWLGGWPYEAITPAEVDALMTSLGFEQVRQFLGRTATGILGSGCDEFVYRRCRSDAGSS